MLEALLEEIRLIQTVQYDCVIVMHVGVLDIVSEID